MREWIYCAFSQRSAERTRENFLKVQNCAETQSLYTFPYRRRDHSYNAAGSRRNPRRRPFLEHFSASYLSPHFTTGRPCDGVVGGKVYDKCVVYCSCRRELNGRLEIGRSEVWVLYTGFVDLCYRIAFLLCARDNRDFNTLRYVLHVSRCCVFRIYQWQTRSFWFTDVHKGGFTRSV